MIVITFVCLALMTMTCRASESPKTNSDRRWNNAYNILDRNFHFPTNSPTSISPIHFFNLRSDKICGEVILSATTISAKDPSVRAYRIRVLDDEHKTLASGLFYETSSFDMACRYLTMGLASESSMLLEHYVRNLELYHDIGDFYITQKSEPEQGGHLHLVRGNIYISIKRTIGWFGDLRTLARAIDKTIMKDIDP